MTTGSNGLFVSGGKVEAEVVWYLCELKRALEIELGFWTRTPELCERGELRYVRA